MQIDKSPGNDRLTKEFCETFWNELKEIFVDSVLVYLKDIIKSKEKKTAI